MGSFEDGKSECLLQDELPADGRSSEIDPYKKSGRWNEWIAQRAVHLHAYINGTFGWGAGRHLDVLRAWHELLMIIDVSQVSPEPLDAIRAIIFCCKSCSCFTQCS